MLVSVVSSYTLLVLFSLCSSVIVYILSSNFRVVSLKRLYSISKGAFFGEKS